MSARERIVARVNSSLAELEMLSDGKAAALDPNKVHGGESAGLATLRDKTPFEFFCSVLAAECDRMNERAGQERRFVAPPATKAQEDYWFTQYEGTDYRTVANKENLEPMDVWRRRERMGLNPQNGKAEQAA